MATPTRPCPFCGAAVLTTAAACGTCGRPMPGASPPAAAPPKPAGPAKTMFGYAAPVIKPGGAAPSAPALPKLGPTPGAPPAAAPTPAQAAPSPAPLGGPPPGGPPPGFGAPPPGAPPGFGAPPPGAPPAGGPPPGFGAPPPGAPPAGGLPPGFGGPPPGFGAPPPGGPPPGFGAPPAGGPPPGFAGGPGGPGGPPPGFAGGPGGPGGPPPGFPGGPPPGYPEQGPPPGYGAGPEQGPPPGYAGGPPPGYQGGPPPGYGDPSQGQHGLPGALARLPQSAPGTLFGVPLSRLRDVSIQKTLLMIAGIALLASVFVPFRTGPTVWAWDMDKTFALVVWPLLAGAVYLGLTVAPAEVRKNVPPVVLQWLPFGVSLLGIVIMKAGGEIPGAVAVITAAAKRDRDAFMAAADIVDMAWLYALGYALLCFGLLARLAQPDDQMARIVIAVGAGLTLPVFFNSFGWMFSFKAGALFGIHNLLFFVVSLIIIACIGFVVSPRKVPQLAALDAFAPHITAVLLLWLPLQVVLVFLAVVVHGDDGFVSNVLTLAHMLLPVVAFFGVLMVSAPAAWDELKAMLARQGAGGPPGGYPPGGYQGGPPPGYGPPQGGPPPGYGPPQGGPPPGYGPPQGGPPPGYGPPGGGGGGWPPPQ